MSPLVWDLAHIGQQEELWLLRGNDPHRPGMLAPDVERLYDAFVHSRASRVDLPLLPPPRRARYCATVRDKALDALDALPDDDVDADFDFGLVVSHENQHDETMLQALNLRAGPRAAGPRRAAAGRAGRVWRARRCWCPAGRSSSASTRSTEPLLAGQRAARPRRRRAGLPHRPGAGDQRRMAAVHRRRRLPRSRGGGRSAAGQHREQAGLDARRSSGTPTAPAPGSATSRTFPPTNPSSTSPTSRPRPTRPGRARGCPPRSSGRRRARGIRHAGARRRFPWGASEPTGALANLGGDALRPAPVGAYPAGASAYGAEQMLGDVWEWTTSPLRPWPGFTPMLYELLQPAVLRRRLPGAARRIVGGGGRASCGRASATGTTRSAGRSSPASGWPGTSDVSPPGLAR